MVAGPIERAKNLLPQFYVKRVFEHDKALDGMRQILWGLFKKIVIADNCATYANEIFNNYGNYSGSTLLLGAIFFAFQIYGDFSGYSDIAIGTSRLFGFNLMRNFAYPYFSRDIAEFWRRWHISLSTWFRDYVYVPLGGSRGGTWMKITNTFIIFIVSGFWHGANWTFVVWGFINACYFMPLMLLKQNRKNTDLVAEKKLFPSITELLQIILTFFLTIVAWVFFRAENISSALNYLSEMFSLSLFKFPEIFPLDFSIIVIIFVLIEWFNRDKQHPLNFPTVEINKFISILRWCGICILIWSIILWGATENKEFIYFQF